MTVCNQNRVDCGLLDDYLAFLDQSKTRDTEEDEASIFLKQLYKWNGCGRNLRDATEIENEAEHGNQQLFLSYLF